jgi:hypothetical protein
MAHNQKFSSQIVSPVSWHRVPPSGGVVACPCARMFGGTCRIQRSEKDMQSSGPMPCDCSKRVGPYRSVSLRWPSCSLLWDTLDG